jgi:hypothetical protein
MKEKERICDISERDEKEEMEKFACIIKTSKGIKDEEKVGEKCPISFSLSFPFK